MVQYNHVSSIDSCALVTETEVGELLSMELLQGEHLKPNHITHTALISAYCRERKLQQVFTLFEEMVRSGIMPNEITYSSLINGLCKAGKLLEARDILKDYFPIMSLTQHSLMPSLKVTKFRNHFSFMMRR